MHTTETLNDISPIKSLAILGGTTGLLLSRLAFGFELYPTIIFTLGLGAVALALLAVVTAVFAADTAIVASDAAC